MKSIRREYLNIGIGITLALFIFELSYVHPVLTSTVFSGGWSIVDVHDNDLGRSFIEMQVAYTPDPLSSSIGQFSFPIRNHLMEKCEQKSVFLGDTLYEIETLHKNKTLEKIQGRYLGTVDIDGTSVYKVVLMPRNLYTFKGIRDKYGLVDIDIQGKILNHTSGEVLVSGNTKLTVFIMFPHTRIITFVLLLIHLFLRYL